MIPRLARVFALLVAVTPCCGFAQSLDSPLSPRTGRVPAAKESGPSTKPVVGAGNPLERVSTEVTHDGCRIRTQRDEDGSELVETISYDGRTILHSIKTFRYGHRFERRAMPHASREEFFDSNLALLARLFNAPHAEPGKTIAPTPASSKPKTVIPPELLKAAEDGNPGAMFAFGHKYVEDEEWDAALPWLEKAAKKGNVIARMELERVEQQIREKKASP